jgi:hypothetical protein
MAPMMSEHSDAETIAAFAEGRLKRAQLPALMAHLERCPSCRAGVEAATEAFHDEEQVPRTRRSVPWLAVAAALVVLVGGAWLLVPLLRSLTSPTNSPLVALAPSDRRVVEPRLSGGFAWAPYRGALRATGESADPRTMKLIGVAGELAERADRQASPTSQHAAGVAMLLIEKPEEAVRRLRDTAQRAGTDPAVWSDLAAAEYSEALRAGRPSLYPEALAAADRALQIAPRRPEALFNRALILERMGLSLDARVAWQQYLGVDGGSPWAVEARAHLSRLPEQTGESRFKRDVPAVESAAAAGDAAAIRRFVAAYPQQSRAYGEAEWLGQWGEATNRGDAATAARALAASAATGEALAAISGESLLRDAVAAIRSADDGSRATLAAAHVAYRIGRKAYAGTDRASAEPQLRHAAADFARGGSPMALVARYYAGCARFDQNDLAGSRRELESLLAAMPPGRGYGALTAQIEWELGLCQLTAGDGSAALPFLQHSEATFTRLGERSNAAFVETLIADTLASLGRLDDSWAARVHSFATLSAEGRGVRLPVSLGDSSRSELRAGRLESARALLRLEQRAERAAGNDYLVADALLRESVLASRLGDATAPATAGEAEAAARRIADPALRARTLADVDFATAAAILGSDGARARLLLTRAIDAYRNRELPLYLPESFLLRARIARQMRDDADAGRDLEAGMAALEQHREQIAGDLSGTGILNAGDALYEDAIALALDRGDVPAALAYAERSRAMTPESIPAAAIGTLQQKLAGTGAAVLELIDLPGELVSICVNERRVDVVRRPVSRAAVATLSPAALYDLLIASRQEMLAGARSLIVVPGPRLESISFAALRDARYGHYLVERMEVVTAPSAMALRRNDPPMRPQRVLGVVLPSGDAAALPEGEAETRALRGIYGAAEELPANAATFSAFLAAARGAGIIHIAGHTERQPGAGDAALPFVGQAVTWSSIAGESFEASRLIVLAACETLRRPDAAATRTLSLGGGFVAAGAPNVIGTLTPVADADARPLFEEIHRRLAAGAGPAEALRGAQLQAITLHGSPAWQSLALVTTRIPS